MESIFISTKLSQMIWNHYYTQTGPKIFLIPVSLTVNIHKSITYIPFFFFFFFFFILVCGIPLFFFLFRFWVKVRCYLLSLWWGLWNTGEQRRERRQSWFISLCNHENFDSRRQPIDEMRCRFFLEIITFFYYWVHKFSWVKGYSGDLSPFVCSPYILAGFHCLAKDSMP